MEKTIIDLGKVSGETGLTGKNGITPHIGANGNWFVGETDTGVSAKGDVGQTGANGTTYNWLTGSVDPSNSLGAVGDMYLNTSSCDVYKKTAMTTWTLQCNIKGASETNLNMELIFSGDANTVGSSYTVTKAITNFKALLFKSDNTANAPNQYGQTLLMPVNAITFKKVSDLRLFLIVSSSGARTILSAYFDDVNTFVISSLTLAPENSRVGVTKIWGVY